jgi:bifunctional UDP-N-acetylglucosamine pyrophosphorylase/glucosamine-1-phosphate N-acetyltransferase
MKETTAIVLAAGKGTRMRSRRAKILHPLLGRPLLAYPLDACREAGIHEIVVVAGHQADAVREAFQGQGVRFALQEEQLGTAHAVLCARPEVSRADGTAVILSGDVPLLRAGTLERLVADHERSGALVTVLTMVPGSPDGYGRIVRDEAGNVARIVEDRDADEAERAVREVNAGTYAVRLPWLWKALEEVGSDNSQGEYYLPDIVDLAAREGKAASVLLDDPDEVLGVNSREQLAEASALLRLRINRAWMEAGVTVEDPAGAWIEPGVELAPDVTVGAGCRLEGRTRVGAGSRIEQGSVLTDSVVGENVRIRPYCVLTDAEVGDEAQVGPFAHLRPRAKLGRGAKAGNFVELKNAVLGPGSKANHLSYLGDAEIGSGTNIGAGTITCNYDGEKKHRTTVGDRAFIGSNASLVAPVTVGDDAVIGAGSTITQDVEPGALGIGRARQRNLAGWRKKAPRGKTEE